MENNPIDFTDPSGLLLPSHEAGHGIGVFVVEVGWGDNSWWDYFDASNGGLSNDISYRGFEPLPEFQGGNLGVVNVTAEPDPVTDGYKGGDGNPITQLAPCLELFVPKFDELASAASTVLKNTFGDKAAEKYDKFSNYEKAVFVNTTVAAADAKADLSSAKFLDFYRADYGFANGIYVESLGSSGTTKGRHKNPGSVEFEKAKDGPNKGKMHIDVDLYNAKSNLFGHWGEVRFNQKHKRGTHPGDVIFQLEKRGLNTGVSCRRQ